jgi:LCP family protein required for cell wall assembly
VLGAGVVLVLLCMLGASVAGYTLVKYNSIERVNDLALARAPKGEPENFLIVAVDTREGQGSKNTDTIMVVRVDPQSDRLALTSFPRDLMVTIADTGEVGMINSAYARDAGGEQVLIDTLRQNFDITINHFVEVNFESFQEVVDAIGGVSIHMDRAARDGASGFYSEVLGCTTLDGEMGLAFVRSRKMDVMIDGEWERDPLSDVHRVRRQQVFIQRAMSQALGQVKSNPLRLRELVDIGVSNIRLDDSLGIGDILDLAEHFKSFDAANLETYPLPVVDYPTDPNRLLLDEAEAEPSLNVFRGLAPGEIRPGLIDVTVLNGTVADEAQQRKGLAADVSSALQRVGFKLNEPSDADEFYAQTTIEYAPGQEVYAQRLARHVTSDVAIPAVENPDLAPGQVTLIAGADFTTVHEAATPVDAMPAPAGGDAGGDAPAETTTTTAGTTDTTVAERPSTTTTTENPFILGTSSERAGC